MFVKSERQVVGGFEALEGRIGASPKPRLDVEVIDSQEIPVRRVLVMQ